MTTKPVHQSEIVITIWQAHAQCVHTPFLKHINIEMESEIVTVERVKINTFHRLPQGLGRILCDILIEVWITFNRCI